MQGAERQGAEPDRRSHPDPRSREDAEQDAEQEEAAENGGEIPEELQAALGEYIEAFGEKVDRIAGYLKAQDAFAELAKKEEERLRARGNAAENRVKRLKRVSVFVDGGARVQAD